MSEKIDRETLQAIKDDLMRLTGKRNMRDGIRHSVLFLAEVFYEIEDAIKLGVTIADILAVLSDRGVSMPSTRFRQAMYILRQSMPERKRVDVVDMEAVEQVGADVRSLTERAKERSTAVKTVKPKRPVVKKSAGGSANLRNKVVVCAEILTEFGDCKTPDLVNVNEKLRAAFGAGWTIKSALQFAAGSLFESWVYAPWPDTQFGENLARIHRAADKLVRSGDGMPKNADVPRLFKKAMSDRSVAGRKGNGVQVVSRDHAHAANANCVPGGGA